MANLKLNSGIVFFAHRKENISWRGTICVQRSEMLRLVIGSQKGLLQTLCPDCQDSLL